MRTTDRRRTRKVLGLRVTTVGFPLAWENVTTISGPHPLLPWRTVKYYERGRRS
jgi:hypothetical protein